MQSPVVVGFASVIPGLGFILLNKFRWAVNAFVLVVGLFVAGLFIRSEFWSSFLIQFSALAWIGQIIYAVQNAKIQSKLETGEISPIREATPLSPAPSSLSHTERLAYKVTETLRQQLLPGEFLQDAVLGAVTPSARQHMLTGAVAMLSMKQYYLGIINQGIVLLELDMLSKPFKLERVSNEKIKSIEFRKRFLQDEMNIYLYGEKPLELKVSYMLRKHTENISKIFQSRSSSIQL